MPANKNKPEAYTIATSPMALCRAIGLVTEIGEKRWSKMNVNLQGASCFLLTVDYGKRIKQK